MFGHRRKSPHPQPQRIGLRSLAWLRRGSVSRTHMSSHAAVLAIHTVCGTAQLPTPRRAWPSWVFSASKRTAPLGLRSVIRGCTRVRVMASWPDLCFVALAPKMLLGRRLHNTAISSLSSRSRRRCATVVPSCRLFNGLTARSSRFHAHSSLARVKRTPGSIFLGWRRVCASISGHCSCASGNQSTKDDHHRSYAPSDTPPRVYWGFRRPFTGNWRPNGLSAFTTNSGTRRTTVSCVSFTSLGSARQACARRRSSSRIYRSRHRTANIPPVGPFSYAKGPVVFVSRSALESAMKPTSWARQNLKQIIDDERTIARPDGNDVPYDDVWLGLALATSLSASDAGSNGDAGKVTAVHIGAVALAEGIPGQARGPYTFQTTTLAWHNAHALNKLDSRRSTSAGDAALAARIRAVHAIGHSKRHCDTPDVLLTARGSTKLQRVASPKCCSNSLRPSIRDPFTAHAPVLSGNGVWWSIITRLAIESPWDCTSLLRDRATGFQPSRKQKTIDRPG